MSDCYTPTDGEVLEAWAAHNTPDLPTALDLVGAYDAFKRWLAAHDAKVRAAALREAYADLQAYTDSGAPFGHRPVEEFLLHRADQIEREAGLK